MADTPTLPTCDWVDGQTIMKPRRYCKSTLVVPGTNYCLAHGSKALLKMYQERTEKTADLHALDVEIADLESALETR